MAWAGKRKCAAVGCSEDVSGKRSRCDQHASQAELTRGRRQQRGYDREYELARAQALIGSTHCWKCGLPFTAENPATGGHVKDIRAGGTVQHGIRAECTDCKNRPHRRL